MVVFIGLGRPEKKRKFVSRAVLIVGYMVDKNKGSVPRVLLILGLAFKENCPDLRNTRVVDVYRELKAYNVQVDVYDPCCSATEVKSEYGIDLIDEPDPNAYDGIFLAVAHDQFRAYGVEKIRTFGKLSHVLYDLKFMFPADKTDLRL